MAFLFGFVLECEREGLMVSGLVHVLRFDANTYLSDLVWKPVYQQPFTDQNSTQMTCHCHTKNFGILREFDIVRGFPVHSPSDLRKGTKPVL
jgi:hypothetical protein